MVAIAMLWMKGRPLMAQDTPQFATQAIPNGCNPDDPTDEHDGARLSPAWTPVIHDPAHPFPNDPVTILEGRVQGNQSKFASRAQLPIEALTDQSPSEVAEEDIPWIHYTHDKTMDIVPDPGYKHLLSQFLNFSTGEYVVRDDMEVEWDNGGVGAEEGTDFIDNIWGALPEWAWASVGDRVWIAGRWIWDCGHVGIPSGTTSLDYVGYTTEIHPPRAVVVFRQNHRLSLLSTGYEGDGGTGGESAPSTWLPITGGKTAIPVTEADVFVSGFGGAAQDICSVTDLGISKSGDSNYGDCTHTSPVIAVNDRNYVFDIYPPGTDYSAKNANGNWNVTPPAGAALQWKVIDRFAQYASWIPTHTCGKGGDSVAPATCYTVEPILCLVDDSTKPPTQAETGCPPIPAFPTRLRVILPFMGSNANIFAQSIMLGWDDVPQNANANHTYAIRMHEFKVLQNGEGSFLDGDWRVYTDIGGQWRYLSNKSFFDRNGDGDNVCDGDSLLENGNNNCFRFDNHPWYVSAPAGMPIHVAVGGYESDSVDGWLCWEKDNYFNGGDCNFNTFAGLALATENDDRIGSLEFDLDPAAGYQQVVSGSVTYDVGVNGLTLTTTKLDDACRHLKTLLGQDTGDCSQDGNQYLVQLTVNQVDDPTVPASSALKFGTPSYTNSNTSTVFASAATPISVSTDYAGQVAFQYRYVPDGGSPPTFSFGLPFPFHWAWTDTAGGPRTDVPISGSSTDFSGDGFYTVQYAAESNECGNLFTCGVTEPRHSARFYRDTTPPATVFVQPTANAQYGHSDTLTLNYSENDGAGSGVNASTVTPKMDSQGALQFCNSLTCLNSGQAVYLQSMQLGPHTFSVDATDNVGNAGTNSVTFTITVTFASLGNDVTTLAGFGCIDNINQSLSAKIAAALNAYAKGQIQTAINILQATIYEVQAQTGHHISTTCRDPNGVTFNAAQFLLGDLQYLQGTLAAQLHANPIVGNVVTSGNVPVYGATVNLMNGKTVVATTTTDAFGFYYFADVSGLGSGFNYGVSIALPKGFKSSSPAAVNFTWSGNAVVGNFVVY